MITEGVQAMVGRMWRTAAVLVCLLVFGGSGVFAAGQDLAEAEKSFIQFKGEWVQKLNKHCKLGRENAEVLSAPNEQGLFVAQYSEVDEPTHEVKETGVKESPFVGILRYDRKTYSAAAMTKEDALKGPFDSVSLQGVTEIFRYSKGKWVY